MSRYVRRAACAALSGMIATVLGTSSVWADRALVIGAPEPERRGILGGSGVPDVADALRRAGFEVSVADVASVDAMRAGLSEFMKDIEDEPRVVIHLTGQFVRSSQQSWLLQTPDPDAKVGPNLANVGGVGLSLATILEIAGEVPGGAVVALGREEGDAPGPGLTRGVNPRSIPQGVTVVQGDAEPVARFVAGALIEPGTGMATKLAAAEGVSGRGFVSDRLVFIPKGEERPVARPDPAEVERAIWSATEAQDDLAGYRGYLERFPEGVFAKQAQDAIAEIQAEPLRAARLGEEALDLNRDARRKIQRELTLLDYTPRGVDGIFGSGTRSAVERFQNKNGFPVTGYLDALQIQRLALQAKTRQAEIEAEAERKKLEVERQDRAFWAASGAKGDEAGLRTYIAKYPKGLFAATANAGLKGIEAERAAEAARQDKLAWDRAQEAADLEGYRAYLRAYPKGEFAAKAEAEITALTPPEPPEQPASESAADAETAPETPVEPSSELTEEARAAAKSEEDGLGLNQLTRMAVETRLAQLGFDPGKSEGVFDADSRTAIAAFQEAQEMPATGYLNMKTLSEMLGDVGGLLAPGK